MSRDRGAAFAGGRNIAVKVPPHQWEATARRYRETLGLEELDEPTDGGRQSVRFRFGANHLWIDRVPDLSPAEVWLQVTTDDPAAAADHLAASGVVRCDEIEPLGTTSAFWITSPASIVHLVSEPDDD